MSTYKRIAGDYNIESVSGTGNVTITTNTVKIYGNLDVGGNVTYINVEELNIRDPFVMLNTSNTGSYSSNSGILTHKAESTFAGLRYNNTASLWELTTSTDANGSTGTWSQISTGNVTVAGANTQIQYNNNNNLGASANYTFDSDTNRLTLQGAQVFGNVVTPPSAVANAVIMYHAPDPAAAPILSGGTSLYAKTTAADGELVSKRKAVIFSIIF